MAKKPFEELLMKKGSRKSKNAKGKRKKHNTWGAVNTKWFNGDWYYIVEMKYNGCLKVSKMIFFVQTSFICKYETFTFVSYKENISGNTEHILLC